MSSLRQETYLQKCRVMNTVQRILKNTGVLLVSNLTQKIFSILFILAMARYLGTSLFGVFTFAVGFTELFVIFTDFGLNTLTVREVARNRSLAQKYLGNFLLLEVLFVFFFWVLIVSVINVLNYPKQTMILVYLLAIHIIFRAFSNLFYSLFRAFEKMEYQSFAGILSNGLMLTGVLFAVQMKRGLTTFALVYVIVSALDLLFALGICVWKFIKPRLEFDKRFWKTAMIQAWPLGTISVFFIIYFRIDTVMLSLMKSDADVGIYGAAFRLSEPLAIIPIMFQSSLFPVLSNFFKKSPDSFAKAYAKSSQYLLSLGLGAALLTSLFADPLVRLVYGEEFSQSTGALRILVWASALMYVSIIQGATYVAADRPITRMKIFAGAVGVNIALNLVMIPKLSFTGASIATVMTEAFSVILGSFLLARFGYRLDFFKVWIVPLMGLAASSCLVLGFVRLEWPLLVASSIAFVVYVCVVLLLGIKQEDKELFKFALSR